MNDFDDDSDKGMLEDYIAGISESIPKGAPESDFADPPKGLYVGDAKHARLAVQAVTTGFRGNTAKSKSKPGVKAKIAAAVRKFYKGAQQKYYLSWLRTGKKPDKMPTGEMVSEMISFSVPTVENPLADIPLDPAILLRLKELDPNASFVTRPIGLLDGESDNGLKYDEYLMSEIERQVLEKRPPARLGHVAEADKSWKVPDTVARWVAALRVGPVLYGKAYVYPGQPFHEDVQVSDAVGAQLANSIFGDASLIVDEDGTMRCVGLDLESIDFVPPERAALKELGGEFDLTTEMYSREETMAEKHDDRAADLDLIKRTVKPEALYEAMSEEQKRHAVETYMKECSPDKMFEMVPKAKRKALAENLSKGMGMKLTREQDEEEEEEAKEEEAKKSREEEAKKPREEEGRRTREEEAKAKEEEAKAKEEGRRTREEEEETREESKKSVAEMAALRKSVAEMEKTIRRYERDDFERALDEQVKAYFADWQVRGEDGKKKLAALEKNLRVLTVAEMAGSTKTEDIKQASEKAWENVKPLAETTKASLAGPNAFVGPSNNHQNAYGFDPQTGLYDEEAKQRAIARTNILPPRGGNPS